MGGKKSKFDAQNQFQQENYGMGNFLTMRNFKGFWYTHEMMEAK